MPMLVVGVFQEGEPQVVHLLTFKGSGAFNLLLVMEDGRRRWRGGVGVP